MDWKRVFNFGPTEVFGLDVGSSTVKIIQLHKDNGSYAVTAATIADIAAGKGDNDFSKDDNELREISTVRAIQECLEFARTQTKLAVCSVCGPQVAVRDFKFPLLQSEEIEGAVMLEAAQSCPFNVKDGTVDHQLIPVGKDETGGVLVAATNAIIKNKLRQLQEASLDCVLIDVDGLALLNCFNACEKREAGRPTSVLNVGSSYTNLAIIGDNNWPFIRDVAYAGNDIIREIADENTMSIEDVRKALFNQQPHTHLSAPAPASPDASRGRGQADVEEDAGAGDSPSPSEELDSSTDQSGLRDSLERACWKLTADVTKTLRYYTAQEKTTLADKIYVCGGFALAKGFVQILNNQLPAEAVLWNPFDKMRCNTGYDHRGILQKNVLQRSGPALAVAAGLAMRSI